jgi:hypothetical protein
LTKAALVVPRGVSLVSILDARDEAAVSVAILVLRLAIMAAAEGFLLVDWILDEPDLRPVVDLARVALAVDPAVLRSPRRSPLTLMLPPFSASLRFLASLVMSFEDFSSFWVTTLRANRCSVYFFFNALTEAGKGFF